MPNHHSSPLLLSMTSLIISIVIGLIIWLVSPIIINDYLKKKSSKKAMLILCKIIGIAIIAIAVINFIIALFQ